MRPGPREVRSRRRGAPRLADGGKSETRPREPPLQGVGGGPGKKTLAAGHLLQAPVAEPAGPRAGLVPERRARPTRFRNRRQGRGGPPAETPTRSPRLRRRHDEPRAHPLRVPRRRRGPHLRVSRPLGVPPHRRSGAPRAHGLRQIHHDGDHAGGAGRARGGAPGLGERAGGGRHRREP